MEDLNSKVVDEKRNIAVADALDEIRSHNARRERRLSLTVEPRPRDEDAENAKDAELARSVFAPKRKYNEDDGEIVEEIEDEQKPQVIEWQNPAARRKKRKERNRRPRLLTGVKISAIAQTENVGMVRESR